ncbi:diacylglycerol lipase-alpha [Anopheles ziemanni]|uniref:diacylglycerol lipase-alpha n=1 Tax=Anopheles coustani TaxID=139045 RepID=UPI00265B6565|nr:diacylglycerol lipase-alpha [Anopheles coustani]XP_058175616.1 diacylglycerol lipase-alpha [Anopheles ziemanni]
MPGIVVFQRRWSVGSDDLVVPGLFLLVIHFIWFVVLSVVTLTFHFDRAEHCIQQLWYFEIGYIILLAACVCLELAICIVSMRGSILDTDPRSSMQYLLYARLLLMLADIAWLTVGIIWLRDNYVTCPVEEPKEVVLAAIACNLFVILSMITTVWCTFDPAGRSWVKMKKYQRSMRESESRFNYKRSGSRSRNWRQRKVIRAYQDSWDHRCRLLFCCMGNSDRSRNSFTDIARLLSDFFRDLDVVPSDVVAGLVLLRKFQKLEREVIVRQQKNGTHKFLSGVPITASTQFLALNDSRDYDHFQAVIRYMYFAQGAYGWPMYLMSHSSTGVCHLASELRYCFCRRNTVDVVDDNCCFCNYAALKKMLELGEVEVIYATYHVDIAETPFFVAIDYNYNKIVISIRGTLSMKDVLTDLNAEGEPLPLNPPREDWLGHKGMVQAAIYIKKKLEEENLIQRALVHNPTRGTQNFGLILVGHSLGAGTAAILAILMKQEYEVLHCYSYSPPGGLLSMPAVEYSKSFITSVVVGKDVVPRIGLYQMEALRADLINAIQRSIDPKWKTIACSVICCCCGPEPTSVTMMSTKDSNVQRYKQDRNSARQSTVHPNDNSIALTLHHPLYPPGRIIHIVRHHPAQEEQMLKKREPVYQAIWADNKDFDEVLISPVMIQDHMPDTVLAALEKVVASIGPQKPHRQFTKVNPVGSPDAKTSLIAPGEQSTVSEPLQSNPATPVLPHKICLETSFTNMQLIQLHREGLVQQQQPPPQHDDGSKVSSLADCSALGRRSAQSSLVDDSGIPKSISGPSEVTTVILAEVSAAPPPPAPAAPSSTVKTLNFIATVNPTRNDLYLMFQPAAAGTAQGPLYSRSDNLSLGVTRRNSYEVQKVDLIHDDWFGMAPLASPESLSELSSISSRASMSTGGGLLGEHPRPDHQKDTRPVRGAEKGGSAADAGAAESQLHTPKVLRRTPKVTGNLSTCAEDARTVYQYKRMGKIFVLNQPSSDSSTTLDSYDTEQAVAEENSILATINEKDLPQGTLAPRSADTGDDKAKSCTSSCPSCPCRTVSDGKCCEKFNHRECYNYKYTSFNVFKFHKASENVKSEPAGTGVSSGVGRGNGCPAGGSRMTTTTTTTSITSGHVVTEDNNSIYQAQIVPPVPNSTSKDGLLESHFPVFYGKSFEDEPSAVSQTADHLASNNVKPLIAIKLRGHSNNVQQEARSDNFPLLLNLAEHSPSPNGGFGRRKNTVHPTDGKIIVVDGFNPTGVETSGESQNSSICSYSSSTPKHTQRVSKSESNV